MHLKFFCFFHQSTSILFSFWIHENTFKNEKNRADLDSKVQFLWFCVARTISLIFLKLHILYVSIRSLKGFHKFKNKKYIYMKIRKDDLKVSKRKERRCLKSQDGLWNIVSCELRCNTLNFLIFSLRINLY